MDRPSEVPDSDDALLIADHLAQPVVDASTVDRIVAEIQGSGGPAQWEQGVELDLGEKRWRPSAVTESRTCILYVCLLAEIPNYVSTRLTTASSLGKQIYVALRLEALFSHETLSLLASLDACVFLIDEGRINPQKPLHFMAAMSDLGVPVEPSFRAQIGMSVWDKINSGTPQQKGRRLEALLAFLLSQVADLRVVERNHRTETQEIDLVLQIDNFSPRVWQRSGPLMLVEAKNTGEPTPQHVVSLLIHKVRTKRGSSKIGMLISTSGFTTDAKMEELRISESDTCVVMLDSRQLVDLIGAADLDTTLESYVRSAMLR